MATRTRQELVDDIDGSDAVETIAFAYDGVQYEIDVNETHAKEVRTDLDKWAALARRVGGRKTSGSRAASNGHNKRDTVAMRVWALDNGFEVSKRGRIPREVEDAYNAAKG
jgi:hypothetical protein